MLPVLRQVDYPSFLRKYHYFRRVHHTANGCAVHCSVSRASHVVSTAEGGFFAIGEGGLTVKSLLQTII